MPRARLAFPSTLIVTALIVMPVAGCARAVGATFIPRGPSHDLSATVESDGAPRDRTDDWGVVVRLAEGTRVRVTTRQGQDVNGRVAAVNQDTVQVGLRWGRTKTLPRDEVVAVRLGHRVTVAQHTGLGSLLGGLAGVLIGSAAACDSNVCGGEGGLAVAGGLVSGIFMGALGGFVVGEAVHARPGRLIYATAPPTRGPDVPSAC